MTNGLRFVIIACFALLLSIVGTYFAFLPLLARLTTREDSTTGPALVVGRSPAIMANVYRQSLGIIDPGSSREATFTITNNTTEAIRLRMSEPSCTCSSAKLENEHLLPAQKTQLILRVKNSGKAGPFSASVKLFGEDQTRWEQLFVVDACGEGVVFRQQGVTILSDSAELPTCYVGYAFIHQGDDPVITAIADLQGPKEFESGFSIDEATVGVPEPVSGYAKREIRICVRPRMKVLSELNRKVRGIVAISVQTMGKNQTYAMPLEFRP